MHLFSRSRPLSAESLGDGVCFWDVGNHRREASGRLDVEWPEQDLARMVDAVEGVARTRGLDVVHWHYAVPFAQIAADVRRRLGPLSPTIVGTLHGTDVSVQAADLRIGPRLRREMATVDALTTVSRSHAALAATMLGLTAPPVVIPNFVDRYRFVPVPRERGIRPAIAHVSNFRSIKNPALAARVFAGVRRDLDAELWLVGDGEEMQRTRREVELHGLRRSTRFFGLRRDVETILPFADVLLVTSRFESFCLVALEAAACGVPVVAPRVGGIPDVVVEGETGLLYEVGNAAAAVQAVRRLLTDRELHARMRRAAVERATTFSNDLIVPRYELLYRTLIDRAHLADVETRAREAAV